MDLVHELCPVQLLEVTKKSDNLSGIWLIYGEQIIYFFNTKQTRIDKKMVQRNSPVRGGGGLFQDDGGCDRLLLIPTAKQFHIGLYYPEYKKYNSSNFSINFS